MNKIAEHAKRWMNAGHKVFPIHPFKNKKCLCGDEDCQAAGKHPAIHAWNKVPLWSDEQFNTMLEVGEFDYGYGLLTEKLLIVDIDVRNGGDESALPEDLQAGLVVASGSGDGSTHHYYLIPENIAIHKNIKAITGIDFISSSAHFVVGIGSKHKSGSQYKIIEGSIEEIEQAPTWLIDLIKKDDRVRIKDDERGYVDISNRELFDCVMHISDYDDRDNWVHVGMAIHNATNGENAGFKLWADWSAQSDKYNSDDQRRVWESFKNNANPVTFATLKYMAQQNGWIEPVTFHDEDLTAELSHEDYNGLPFPVGDLDMLRPPGFVGDVTTWINSQCAYPRERLAVAVALSSVGDIAGLRCKLDDGMTRANTIFFCIAGSSSGKESVLQARYDLLEAAGIPQIQHGKWKSEQEIIKNLLRHDQSTHVVDELGIQLAKVDSAIKRGGAVYLEGVIGEIMSIFSKSLGTYSIGGDLRDDIKAGISNQIKLVNKLAKNGEITDEEALKQTDILRLEHKQISKGIKNPFLSVVGFSTPSTFEKTISFDNLTNGFLARALIVDEVDTNPKKKRRFRKSPMSKELFNNLCNLHSPGFFNTDFDRKVKAPDKLTAIPSSNEALDLIDLVYEYQHSQAEKEKEKTGLEAIWRRLEELTNKISLILAIPSGLRTSDHVRWAFEYCRRNCQRKIELALSESEDTLGVSSGDKLIARLLTIIDDTGETLGTICNRCRKYKKTDIEKAIDFLIKSNMIEVEKYQHKGNKQLVNKYKRVYT